MTRIIINYFKIVKINIEKYYILSKKIDILWKFYKKREFCMFGNGHEQKASIHV